MATEEVIELPQCECGCGEPVPRHGKRFRRGHYAKRPRATETQARKLLLSGIVVKPSTGCWLWREKSRTGPFDEARYGSLQLRYETIVAHRVSYIVFNGPIPDGLVACHSCDTPACVNPAHLWLGTRADNNRDRDEKGRHVPLRSESNGKAKLTFEIAEQIRARRLNGERIADLATEFSVCNDTISLICRGKRYAVPPTGEIMLWPPKAEAPPMKSSQNEIGDAYIYAIANGMRPSNVRVTARPARANATKATK